MNTIVIVGGVAAGMSCAARLRRLDEQAHVIVLEKGMDISIASCGLPYFVGGEIVEEAALRVQTPKSIYDSASRKRRSIALSRWSPPKSRRPLKPNRTGPRVRHRRRSRARHSPLLRIKYGSVSRTS